MSLVAGRWVTGHLGPWLFLVPLSASWLSWDELSCPTMFFCHCASSTGPERFQSSNYELR